MGFNLVFFYIFFYFLLDYSRYKPTGIRTRGTEVPSPSPSFFFFFFFFPGILCRAMSMAHNFGTVVCIQNYKCLVSRPILGLQNGIECDLIFPTL